MITNARDRRHFLADVALALGLSVLPAEALLAAPGKPEGMDPPTQALLSAVADTLIPRTDTPGALQAGVPTTFARLMRDWAKPQSAADLLASLAAVDSAAKTEAGKPFALLSKKQRTAFLTSYDAAHLRSDKGYFRLKALLMTLFYLSEPGATQDLRYEHVPGVWQASIPLTPKTRTWAA